VKALEVESSMVTKCAIEILACSRNWLATDPQTVASLQGMMVGSSGECWSQASTRAKAIGFAES
jgi:hypothetical protein